MTEAQWRAFLTAGTRTGNRVTTRRNGRPHVVPVWFVLDSDELACNTGPDTIKGRALITTGWASICVDDERPPFSFVTVSGPVTVNTDLREMLPWSARIAGRDMGEHVADQCGRRNAVDGELLVRLRAEHVVAVSHVAAYTEPGARTAAVWNNGAAGTRGATRAARHARRGASALRH
jgi:PPOX class probable F420-dependent enzyme